VATADDTNSCGQCGSACASPANTAATCTSGGCGYTCNTGFVDVDKDPSNGCECQVRGAEACNRVDGNCNGLVDEGTSSVFYTGPAGTAGIGACQVGRVACVNASPLVQPDALPQVEVCGGKDNTCGGRTGEVFDFANDPSNCGRCGRACAAGESCQSGACKASVTHAGVSCGAPLSECAGAFGPFFTELASGFRNCGACGRTCAAGQACKAGQCLGGSTGTPDAGTPADDGTALTCPAPAQACTGPAGQYCARLQSDVNNCGACGRACPSENSCSAGACVDLDECALGAARCSPDAKCTNTPGSFTCTCNVGFAGNGITCVDVDECAVSPSPCDASAGCVNGVENFRCACNPGFTGSGQPGDCRCLAGQSVCRSPSGANTCADLSSDPLNCGVCGKACAAGSACQGGTCVAPPATVTVRLGGTGNGAVRSTPAGVDCGTRCGASFADGSVVALDAAPGVNFTFAGWGGDCAGAGINLTCTLTVRGAMTVEAQFKDAGGGTGGGTGCGTGGGTGGGNITCSPGTTPCNSPNGAVCVRPSDDIRNCGACGNVCADGYACQQTSCVLASSQSVNLNALKDGSGIGYVSSSPGGIDCGSKCNVPFPQGTLVTLTATPDVGSFFRGWMGPCSGSGNTCTVSLSASSTVTATFELTGGGTGGGSGSGSGTAVVVGFDTQGGTGCAGTFQAVVGNPYGPLCVPSMQGLFFGGWYTAPNAGGMLITETSVVSMATNHTLLAYWRSQ